MYDTEIILKDTSFEACTSQGSGAAIYTFMKCKAAINQTVVVSGGTKIENEISLGKFEVCEPKHILYK